MGSICLIPDMQMLFWGAARSFCRFCHVIHTGTMPVDWPMQRQKVPCRLCKPCNSQEACTGVHKGLWNNEQGNIYKNKELALGLWSHSLLQQIKLQADARGIVPTFSPCPSVSTHIHLVIKWARSGTNSAENWRNQKIRDKFSASLVPWSAMNASAEAQVFLIQL